MDRIELAYSTLCIPTVANILLETLPVASVMMPLKPRVPASSTDLRIRSVATPFPRQSGSTATIEMLNSFSVLSSSKSCTFLALSSLCTARKGL